MQQSGGGGGTGAMNPSNPGMPGGQPQQQVCVCHSVLCVCACVCVFVCVYVWVGVWVYVWVCVWVWCVGVVGGWVLHVCCMDKCVCVGVSECMCGMGCCMCVCARVHACMHICLPMCLCDCVWVGIYYVGVHGVNA